MKHRGLNAYSHIMSAALAAWIIGTAAGLHLSAFPNVWILVFVTVGLLGLLAESEKAWITKLSVILLLSIAAFSLTFFRTHHITPHNIQHWAPKTQAHIEGIIEYRQTKERQKADSSPAYRIILKTLSINGQYTSGNIMLWKVYGHTPSVGSHIVVKGNLRTPKQPAFEHGFNEAQYLRSKNITAVLNRPKIVQILSSEPSTLWGQFQQSIEHLQHGIQHAFQAHLTPQQAQLLGGVVLGDRAVAMETQTRDDFIQTGLIHFLAASGFNVGVVAGAILLLLRRWKGNERWKLLITSFFVLIYVALAGMSPSVLRAGAMVILAFFFRGLNQQLSPLILLLLAVTTLILWHPAMIDDIGFQLSVLTTLGIITMVPATQQSLDKILPSTMPSWLSGMFTVPLIAQLWVIPISITVFNQLPLHSVFLNILSALLVTPLTLIGFSAATLAPFWHAGAGWISILAKPFSWLLLAIVQWGAQFKEWVWHPTSPPIWLMWGMYTSLLFIVWVIHQPKEFGWTLFKKTATSLILPLLLTATCLGRHWLNNQHHQVKLLHPSQYTWALDLKPANQKGHWLFLPKPVGYWDQRNIREYARHHIGSNISGIIYLTGSSETRSPINENADQHTGKSTPTPRLFLETSKKQKQLRSGLLYISEDMSKTPVHSGDKTYKVKQTSPQNSSSHQCLLLITDDTRRTYECAYTLLNYPNRPVQLFQS